LPSALLQVRDKIVTDLHRQSVSPLGACYAAFPVTRLTNRLNQARIAYPVCPELVEGSFFLGRAAFRGKNKDSASTSSAWTGLGMPFRL
jgi:hypothetical protein